MTPRPQPEYFPVTREELNLIKNDCCHPEVDTCDRCEYASDGELPCTWKGANALMDEILTRTPRSNQQTERDKVLVTCPQCKGIGKIVGFWESSCPMCEGKGEIIAELRQQGKQEEQR